MFIHDGGGGVGTAFHVFSGHKVVHEIMCVGTVGCLFVVRRFLFVFMVFSFLFQFDAVLNSLPGFRSSTHRVGNCIADQYIRKTAVFGGVSTNGAVFVMMGYLKD